MEFNGDLHLLSHPFDSVINGERIVESQGVAVPESVCPMIFRGASKLDEKI